MDAYDVAIVGAGPGGLAAAIKAKELGLFFVVLEKGESILQGIIDTYPGGKKVYPTIPKGASEIFPSPDLEPANEPVEVYVDKVRNNLAAHDIDVRLGEDAHELIQEEKRFQVVTSQGSYTCASVILAFGKSIPRDLGIYGEATHVRRRLDDPDQFIGNASLVIGGGNAAADIVAALSRAKRTAEDGSSVYWAHRRGQFRVDKEVARDLGEEILLGGNIRILHEAVPRIGEMDANGVNRLLIGIHDVEVADGIRVHRGLSFPMQHVIACIGMQGPAAVFEKLGLELITSDKITGKKPKSGKQGARFIMLDSQLQTSTEGIYAIGAAISPAYASVDDVGSLARSKHSDLIYSAASDGIKVVEAIAERRNV